MKKGFLQIGFFVLVAVAFSCGGLPLQAVETFEAKKIVPEKKPGKPETAKEEKKKPEEIPTDVIPSSLGDIQALVIPDAFGTIKEMFRGGKEGAFIFHIQDVHANPEVQQNIAKIAEHINRSYFGNSIEIVAVEGARGDVDLGLLRAVPDERVRRDASQYLISQGILTGGEYYGAHLNAKARVFGVEDGLLYFSNLQAFRDTVHTSRDTQAAVEQFQNALAQLATKMLPPDLQEFYAKQQDYRENKLPLSQYCQYLEKAATPKGVNLEVHPNLKTVLKTIALEKEIDFKKMERQQLQLLGDLQVKGTREQATALVEKSLALRTGKLSSAAYYQFLMEMAAEQKMNPQTQFPEVAKYTQLVQLQTQIQAPVLFQEIKWAEGEIKEKLFAKNEDRELDKIKDELTILVKLRGLGLSRDEWNHFSESEGKYNFAGWRRFVQDEATKLGMQLTIPPEWDRLGTQLTSAKKFYEDALKRDDALAKNLFDEMERRNFKVALLVTGGFHSAALTQQIKAKDISYAVITPRMTRPHDDKLYMALMMGEPTEWEKALGGIPTLAAYSRWESALLETIPAEMRGEIQVAIDQTIRLAIGVVLASLGDPGEIAPILAVLQTDPRVAASNVRAAPVSTTKGQLAIVLEFGPEGKRQTVQVTRAPSTEAGKPMQLAFAPVAPPATPGPVALFQGSPSRAVRNTVGELAPGLISIKGNLEVRSNDQFRDADTKALRSEVQKNSEAFPIEGVPFQVDRDLLAESKLTKEQFQLLLEAAFNADPRKAEILRGIAEQRKGESVVIALLDNAQNLFEDHLGNGFVGVHRGLFAPLAEKPDELKLLLQVGLLHELRHESKPVSEQFDRARPEVQVAFEAAQVPQDVALLFNLAAQAGMKIDLVFLQSLARVVDRASPFFTTLLRVSSALHLPAEMYGPLADPLLLGDRGPTDSETDILFALGLVNQAIDSVQAPTIILDIDEFEKNPGELERLISQIPSERVTPDKKIMVVVTGVGVATADELKNRFLAKAEILSKNERLVNLVVVPRTPDLQPENKAREYAAQIATAVQGRSNIRLFTSEKNYNNFYHLVEAAMEFVHTLFKDLGEIKIIMSKAEFEKVQKVFADFKIDIKALGTVVFEEKENRYILHLPANVVLDGKYMEAIENARKILAKQA